MLMGDISAAKIFACVPRISLQNVLITTGESNPNLSGGCGECVATQRERILFRTGYAVCFRAMFTTVT
jgi:hypothetical protein